MDPQLFDNELKSLFILFLFVHEYIESMCSLAKHAIP